MNTISTAYREYATRPKDERFGSVTALIADAQHQKDLSVQVTYNAKDIRAVAVDADNRKPNQGTILLTSPGNANGASPTHYAFGQLGRAIGAPSGYLRSLPPMIAADCINHGLTHTPPGSDLMFLTQRANGGEPKIRSITSETYGRVWDADLYKAIDQEIIQPGGRQGRSWQTPPTWTGESAGAYRGDRDSFLIVVDGGSIVQDPSLTNAGPGIISGPDASSRTTDQDAMFRGLMVRNSEVGACSVVIEQIYFRYVCGNHMLWGAVMDKSFRRRHVGQKALRDTIREISDIAYRWSNRSGAADEAIIRSLIDHEIASSKEAVIDELRKIGFSKQDAESAYDTCEATEAVSPRSFWGIAQGATRISQASGHQDDRFELDMLAAKVLQRGRLAYA